MDDKELDLLLKEKIKQIKAEHYSSMQDKWGQ